MTKLCFLLVLLQLCSVARAEEGVLTSSQQFDHDEALSRIVDAIKEGQLSVAEEQIIQLGDAAPIAQIVHDVYARNETNIDVLVNLTASLMDATLANQFLTVLREELKRTNHNDIRNLITLAKAYRPEVITNQNVTCVKPNPSLSELIHDISDVASAFLVGVMQSDCSYVDNEDVKSLSAALAELPTASSMVMQSLVADCFYEVDKDKLLEGVYSHSDTWQALQGLYQFFWWLEAGPLNGNIVLKHAFLLSEAMKRKDYSNIDAMEKYSIDKMVGKIPACARNLFFEPSFCIWNRLQDAYMVSSDSTQIHDVERRNIFTSPRMENDTLPSGSSWRVKRANDKLFLENVAFPNENMFVDVLLHDAKVHRVFAWVPGGNSDDQSAWNVELLGEHCFLKNVHFDEYLASSDISYGSTSNKYVLSAKMDGPQGRSSAFVWQIRNCYEDPL